MTIKFEVSDLIPAPPEVIYQAWLDSEEHSLMTGGKAKISPDVDGTFEAWDGYIQGKNIKLEYPGRILQAWRTTEFDAADLDSRLEILLKPANEGTMITIRHSGLPDHGMQYQQGWIDAYLDPMKTYFGEISK